jgi:actin, other eukaryote
MRLISKGYYTIRDGAACRSSGIQRSLLRSLKEFVRVLKGIQQKLSTSLQDYPIVFCEPPLWPHRQKEDLAQLLFEEIGVPAAYSAPSSLLSLCAGSRSNTGISIDWGEGTLKITPIVNSVVDNVRTIRREFGGCDVRKHLDTIIPRMDLAIDAEKWQSVDWGLRERVLWDIIHRSNDLPQEYPVCEGVTIPTGSRKKTIVAHIRHILIGPSCDDVGARYDPVGCGFEGLPFYLQQSLDGMDESTKKECLSNVVLSGGLTMIPEFADRLAYEMEALYGGSTKINIVAKEDRWHHVFQGGSIMGSMTYVDKMWVTKDDYDEFGPPILRRRCVF